MMFVQFVEQMWWASHLFDVICLLLSRPQNKLLIPNHDAVQIYPASPLLILSCFYSLSLSISLSILSPFSPCLFFSSLSCRVCSLYLYYSCFYLSFPPSLPLSSCCNLNALSFQAFLSFREVSLSCWFSLSVSDTSNCPSTSFNLVCPSNLRLLRMQFCQTAITKSIHVLHTNVCFSILFVLILSKWHFLFPNPKPTFTQILLDFYKDIIYLFIKLFFSWGQCRFYIKI